ncbi:unnamed protein product [Adineta ricciae]|uniref:Tubulin-tyrosine ligase family protein n=1 Tax=Adineta ricciae TaxID=249248 RepID=A0A814H1P8_ADIRI|nr:unnamed protein product [Adineta ricciae]
MLNKSKSNRINGYYVFGKNNSKLVRDLLDKFDLDRYDTIPLGGVKFNWITRSSDIDWNRFDSNFQILNHIFNEKQVSNKGLLLKNLRTYFKSKSNILLQKFLPETYLLDNLIDRINFKKNFQQNSLWICKPVGLSCGKEIFLFRSEEQLENHLKQYQQRDLYSNRLVQRYIENPLLINQQKFDIRTYFLCICLSNDVLCFACQTGYLRLSMYQFNLEDLNKFIHLTNQTIQNKDENFPSKKNMTGMTIEEFNEYFNDVIQPNTMGIDKDWVIHQLPKQITNILHQVAYAIRNQLTIQEGCFGYYGVDILIDEKLNCWLLEINSGPTLDMTNQALEKVIPMCLNEAIRIVIDTLDNYRENGSAFPLPESKLFKYLPFNTSSILSNQIASFVSINSQLIDLTPGVNLSKRRYRRLYSQRYRSQSRL